MRISSNQIYLRGVNSLQGQQQKLANIQQQISTGKRISRPSDDPVAAARIDLMKSRISQTERFSQNREAVLGALSFEESILGNSVDVLQRLRQLQVQAGNTALAEEDRKAIALEMENILGQIEGLANQQDSNGNFIFSGSLSGNQTITRDGSGNFVYNGDQTQRMQFVTSGLKVAMNDTGDRIFMRIPNGNGDFTVQADATNAGTASATTGSVINQSAWVDDDYRIEFSLNSQGEMVYLISGAASGNIIPPSGLPDDAPLFESGTDITFNGASIRINGNPNAGDGFDISPSRPESIFSTVQRMIANLRQPFSTAEQKAATVTEHNQLLSQLDIGIQNIIDTQSAVGARLNQLDVADALNQDLIEISTQTLSSIEDVDMAEAATALNLQLIYLQAAQQSFVRIQGLSVFNYL